MSLFDLQPLSLDEIRLRQGFGEGPTIRKLSSRGPGPGVWRTIRHKPWWMFEGKGPEGKHCKDCEFFSGTGNAGKYKKCGKQAMSHGPGTDIRGKDEACRLFQEDTV